MSRHYLLQAMRDRIRQALNYKDVECEVMEPPGRPPARAGKRFAAVIGTDYADEGGGESLNEVYGAAVVLTLRVNEPRDRVGSDLLQKTKSGAEDLAAAIRNLLHMDYQTLAVANTAIYGSTATPVGTFIEPLRNMGTTAPRVVAADWFEGSRGGEVGVVVEVRLGRARRIQTIGAAT